MGTFIYCKISIIQRDFVCYSKISFPFFAPFLGKTSRYAIFLRYHVRDKHFSVPKRKIGCITDIVVERAKLINSSAELGWCIPRFFRKQPSHLFKAWPDRPAFNRENTALPFLNTEKLNDKKTTTKTAQRLMQQICFLCLFLLFQNLKPYKKVNIINAVKKLFW